MPVTERLMKPGTFRLELREDAPFSARDAIDQYDHIVITPTRLQPISGFSDANILAAAIYTGMITSKPSGRIVEGLGVEGWLGTPEGLGELIVSYAPLGASNLAAWLTALLPSGIAAGTVTEPGGTTPGVFYLVTPREAIGTVCQALGAEYVVQPDFTIDAGPASSLFVTTPTVVITSQPEGVDGGYVGLDGSLIVTSSDVVQYTTQGIGVAAGQGAGVQVITGTDYGSSYVNGRNADVVMQRIVNLPDVDDTSQATALTNAVASAWNEVRYGLEVTTRSPIPRRFARPGDSVYVHDQLDKLTDPANQIMFRGQVIAPILLRVFAMSWPIEAGMGVYVRRTGATSTYTDLTDFVQWEQADTRWEVGQAPRAAADVDPKKAGRPGYLGANADASARAARPSRTSYTPALTGTGSNPNLGSTGTAVGDYIVVGNECYWSAQLTFAGAGVAAGSGSYRISLPPVTADSTIGFRVMATGWYYTSAATFKAITADRSPGSGLVRLTYHDGTGEVTAAAPSAPAAGSVITLSGSFPLA